LERVQIWGVVEVILGVLVAAAFMCPSEWSNIVLGILVLIFGALTLLHAKPKPAQGKRKSESEKA
jgi:uncharacterized membrane protein HdeD (DUF308 family)